MNVTIYYLSLIADQHDQRGDQVRARLIRAFVDDPVAVVPIADVDAYVHFPSGTRKALTTWITRTTQTLQSEGRIPAALPGNPVVATYEGGHLIGFHLNLGWLPTGRRLAA